MKLSNYILAILLFAASIVSCKKDDTADPLPNSGPTIENELISGGGTSSFKRIFGGKESDGFYSVQVADDGGYILCGWTENNGASSRDILVVKTDMNGETEWLKTYPNEHQAHGWEIAKTLGGGYVIASTHDNDGGSMPSRSGQLIKINSIGDEEWRHSFSFGQFNNVNRVSELTSGDYLVGGDLSVSDEHYIVLIDPEGNTLWDLVFAKRTISNSSIDDDVILICTQIDEGSTKELFKLSASGDTLLHDTISLDGKLHTLFEIQDEVLLFTHDYEDDFIRLLRINLLNDEQTSHEISTTNITDLHNLKLQDSDNLLGVGTIHSGNTKANPFLFKYSLSQEAMSWEKTLSTRDYSILFEIQPTSSGYILGGYSLEDGNGDGYMVKVDENGN